MGSVDDDERQDGSDDEKGDWEPEKKLPSCMMIGCLSLATPIVCLVVLICGMLIQMSPDSGPEGLRVRNLVHAVESRLGRDASVESVVVTYAVAEAGGPPVATLEAVFKDGTSVEGAASLLASVSEHVLGQGGEAEIELSVSVSWQVGDKDIDVVVYLGGDSDDIRSGLVQALNMVDEPAAFSGSLFGEREAFVVDYGEVSAVPESLLDPGYPGAIKEFILDGWEVSSESGDEGDRGDFLDLPYAGIVEAGRRTAGTGKVSVRQEFGDVSMIVYGLVTEYGALISVDAAANVVNAVEDCGGLGLSELELNTTAKQERSGYGSDSRTFICQDGVWASKRGDRATDLELEILQKAEET